MAYLARAYACDGDMREDSLDSPRAAIVDKDGGAEAPDGRGEGDAEGVLEHADGAVLDVVWLEPEDLGVVDENLGVLDGDPAEALFIAADGDGEGGAWEELEVGIELGADDAFDAHWGES